ncbi:MAG: hypothetical protein QXZ12_06885 [Thermoplasmata archaeon]
MKIYRQGDVILRKLDEKNEIITREYTDSDYKISDKLSISGETGNTHELDATVYSIHGTQYVVVETPTLLKHNEHHDIEIEPGIYRVDTVRDFRNRRMD